MKQCNTCQQYKPLNSFYKHPLTKDGRANKCIKCTRDKSNHKRTAEEEKYYDPYYDNVQKGIIAFACNPKEPRKPPKNEEEEEPSWYRNESMVSKYPTIQSESV